MSEEEELVWMSHLLAADDEAYHQQLADAVSILIRVFG